MTRRREKKGNTMPHEPYVGITTFTCTHCDQRGPASALYAQTKAYTICSQTCMQAWWDATREAHETHEARWRQWFLRQ
jgi:transcription elongation factor Elf1